MNNDELFGMKEPWEQPYELKEPEPWTHIIEHTHICNIGVNERPYHHVELDTTDDELVDFILKKVYK